MEDIYVTWCFANENVADERTNPGCVILSAAKNQVGSPFVRRHTFRLTSDRIAGDLILSAAKNDMPGVGALAAGIVVGRVLLCQDDLDGA